jgi:ferredoxin
MRMHRVIIHTPHGTETLPVGEDQHVLDLARAAGLDLPFSCLQGWCLSCAARILQGEINQDDSRRYYEEDREDGFALLCTGRPRSDLEVESHARDAMRAARRKRGLPYPRGDWGV